MGGKRSCCHLYILILRVIYKNPGYTARNTGSQHKIRKRKAAISACSSAKLKTLVILSTALPTHDMPLPRSPSISRHKSSSIPVKITVNAPQLEPERYILYIHILHTVQPRAKQNCRRKQQGKAARDQTAPALFFVLSHVLRLTSIKRTFRTPCSNSTLSRLFSIT